MTDNQSDRVSVDPPRAPLVAPGLEEAAADIVEDSRRTASEYLEETVVPHGGE